MLENFSRDADFYIFHFKTVWCPYNEEDHERSDCVYAHNWQDYRRKPSVFSYSKDPCPKWPSSDTVTSYRQGCPNEFKCQYSHGKREQELHPDIYKVNACTSGVDCSAPHCFLFHSDKERRIHPSNMFKVFPRSRGTSFPSNYYLKILKGHSVMKQTSLTKMTTELHVMMAHVYNLDPTQANIPQATVSQPQMSP